MTNVRPSPIRTSSSRPSLLTLAAIALAFMATGLAPTGCGIGVGGVDSSDSGAGGDATSNPTMPTSPSASASASSTGTGTSAPPGVPAPKVHVVLFTHIEDNTPMGPLDSPQARVSYMNMRARIVEMGKLAAAHKVAWSFQPDWKILVAAKQLEDTQTMASTGGKNFLVYLRDTLGVFVDPHSHENNGYNYPDVAYLLKDLGVGGSTVVGGHVWDPSLPQFAEWDRFRAPVAGLMFPAFTWRGDILMGSGTPNHVNDPIVSGVWRPKARDAYFTDDPAGNVAAVGAYTKGLEGVTELVAKYTSGEVPASCMLTSSYHIAPAALLAPDGIAAIERDVLAPLEAQSNAGKVVLTDFTSLVATWKRDYGAKACLYPTPK